jgi:hypothetical protein
VSELLPGDRTAAPAADIAEGVPRWQQVRILFAKLV